MKRHILLGAAWAAVTMALTAAAGATETLNVIGWCDITDPALNEPFEKAHDVKINIKTHEDPAVAQTIIEQSAPGDWDVFHTDAAMIHTHVAKGLLAPLDPKDFDFDSFFPQVRQTDLHTVDGKLYAVPELFGWNTLAYDKDKVPSEDIASYAVLWDPKYKGRIAVWDFYTQIFQNVAQSLGIEPKDITSENLPAIEARLLALKDNVAVVGDTATIQTALATGDVDIVLGGGQWIVAGLQGENPSLEWTVPSEGGVFYLESAGLLAGSQKKALATEYLKYLVSPEGQARFAMNKCGMAMPASMKAALSDSEKALLRWDRKDEDLSSSRINEYYAPEIDRMMLDIWSRFIQQ